MVQSVDRALTILEYMSSRKNVSVTEIAAQFDLDKGTISRMMQTFEKHGMAVKNDSDAKYRIGSGVLQLSHNMLLCNRMVRAARPALVELADELSTTARLCMIDGKKVFIIDQVEKRKDKIVKDADIPGMSKPLYCSAIGKTIFAYMPRAKLEARLDEMEFVAYTENTITDKERLKSELVEIRNQGYALNIAEFSDRAYCIAVPIFYGEGRELKYCIGITDAQDYRRDKERFHRTVEYMKKVSGEITQNFITVSIDRPCDL